MNSGIKALSISLIAALFSVGCSQKKEEPPVIQEAPKADQAEVDALKSESSEMKSQLNKLTSSFQKETDSLKSENEALKQQTAALQAQTEELKAQSASLLSQIKSSNTALEDQIASLKSKYESAKSKLPASIVEPIEAKLPELDLSMSKLKELANSYSPETMAQVEAFQVKYDKEIAAAKKITDEILALLGKGSLDQMMPKF